tara:strand:+ start:1225 stop:1632 length:408 start_codon:yes stop_codon:yes gene_type:complete
MLVLDEKLWVSDKILKVTSSSDWSEPDTDIMLNCCLERVKELISECIGNNTRCILLLHCTSGEVPSFYYFTKIFSFLFGIRDIINKGVEFSVIYGEKDSIGNVLPNILKIYQPTRPLHLAYTKEELKAFLKNREK